MAKVCIILTAFEEEATMPQAEPGQNVPLALAGDAYLTTVGQDWPSPWVQGWLGECPWHGHDTA